MSSEKVNNLREIIKDIGKSNINIFNFRAIKNHSKQVKLSIFGIFVLLSFLVTMIASLCAKIWLQSGEQCFVSIPDTLSYAFRSPIDCEFCRNITQADRVSNISPRDFEVKYAYNAKPVIVTDATRNWTALDVFDFWYLKDVYDSTQANSERINCQFFPVMILNYLQK